jgi:alpha-glucoside transport system permease protein
MASLTVLPQFCLLLGGLLAFYVLGHAACTLAPKRVGTRILPWVFVGPALAMATIFMVVPGIRTLIASFYNEDGSGFVGLSNYVDLVTIDSYKTILVNTALWVVLVPLIAVVVGLATAALADRLRPSFERGAKSLIFLPMAISFVGAATIWKFVFDYRPSESMQVGLLNGVLVALGRDPVGFLTEASWHLNTLLLIFIMAWVETGFATILLSAALKAVPQETIEAARLDTDSEFQIFMRVSLPQIRGQIIVVATSIIVLVIKTFDVVYTLTGGNFGTDIVANRFYFDLFRYGDQGHASVLVVMLVIVVLPMMILNVRRVRGV